MKGFQPAKEMAGKDSSPPQKRRVNIEGKKLHHSKFLVRNSTFIRRYCGGFVYKFSRILRTHQLCFPPLSL